MYFLNLYSTIDRGFYIEFTTIIIGYSIRNRLNLCYVGYWVAYMVSELRVKATQVLRHPAGFRHRKK